MTWLISLLAITAICLLSSVAWLRSGRRWKTALVETIRVVLVTAAVVILWRPETHYPIDPDRPAPVVVLFDQSDSMNTQDAVTESQTRMRRAVAHEWLQAAEWEDLDARFERVTEPVEGSPFEGTDIAAALQTARRTYPSAAALVLISDGDWSGGESPIEAVASFATTNGDGPKVYTVPLGSAERLPDLELVQADVPTFGVVDRPVRVPFSIANWFDQQRELAVELRVNGETVQRQTFVLAAGGRRDADFTWQSDKADDFEIEVVVEAVDGESIPSNNQVQKPLQIRSETLRVLLIESLPRWEYRYLRNALLRDPGVDVSCLLLHPDLESVGGGGEDYLSELPTKPAEWAAYDVIFLGDVGVGEQQLTLTQCDQIAGLVQQQAVGLVLMPGRLGNQRELLDTDLGALFPVIIDPSLPEGIGSVEDGTLSLTQAGRRSRLTELDEDDQLNWATWESLPGFSWHAAVERAKAGSETLAVHSSSSNEYGRVPLLVTRPAGAGKVLFMGTDSAWRWRRGVEDRFHYRFWGQVIRWMAYQRNMAVGQTMRLSYRPEKIVQGDTVFVRASVMTSGGTPVDVPGVQATLMSSDGFEQQVRLSSADQQWGVYTGRIQLDAPGEYDLLLKHPTEESKIGTALTVQGRAVEQVGAPARPDVMREIARVGHGEVLPAEQIGNLVKELNVFPAAPTQFRRIQWWNHPAVMFSMLGGFTVFWIARKWSGTL